MGAAFGSELPATCSQPKGRNKKIAMDLTGLGGAGTAAMSLKSSTINQNMNWESQGFNFGATTKASLVGAPNWINSNGSNLGNNDYRLLKGSMTPASHFKMTFMNNCGSNQAINPKIPLKRRTSTGKIKQKSIQNPSKESPMKRATNKLKNHLQQSNRNSSSRNRHEL